MRLLLAFVLSLSAFSQSTKETFILGDTLANGTVVAIPIHTPGLILTPDNTVARAMKSGEAINCKVSPKDYPGTVNGEKATVKTVVLDCDGARYTISGLQFGVDY